MLVIPDFFDRRDVKELVSLLLQQFSFKSILINQVSDKLAAAPSKQCDRNLRAQHLDMGSQQPVWLTLEIRRLRCVVWTRLWSFLPRGARQIGIGTNPNLVLILLHSSHRCCTYFGGYDISRLLLWLLQNSPRHHFPYPECDVNSPQDEAILLDLKRDSCHLDKVIECDILCVSICLLAKSLDSDFLLSCPRIRTTDSSPSHEC